MLTDSQRCELPLSLDLESTCSQEVAKLSQSAKDITTLQNSLKEKDKMIDQIKTAGSKLKSVLSSEQKKNGDLEAANASMSTKLQAVKARIERMDDITVQPVDSQTLMIILSKWYQRISSICDLTFPP